jgi:predicted phage terminase large subunit-like protein
MSDEDRLIEDEDINWFSLKVLKKNLSYFDIYITTDFATSAKESADYSVISVWAHNYNRDWYWIDGIVAKQDMGKNIDSLFKLAAKYKPLKVGIETSGQQGGFIPWVKQQMLERNCFFNIAKDNIDGKSEEGFRPNKNKVERLIENLPWIKQGHLYLPEELKNDPRIEEALEELELASNSGFRSLHDDWLDTLSMLNRLRAPKPNNTVIITEEDKEDNPLPDKYRSINLWELEKEEEIIEAGFNRYLV